MVLSGTTRDEGQALLDILNGFGRVLAIKLYRIGKGPGPQEVPCIPCLDHEAMLHERIPPHGAMYVQEAATGELHEVVFIPAKRHIQIDIVSTWGEHTPESRARLMALLREKMPGYRVDVHGPSWWRGERRVANACLAQISLRDVLLGTDMTTVKAAVDRLALVGTVMEKHSRVASWGIQSAP